MEEESEIINLRTVNEEVKIERFSINKLLDKQPEAVRSVRYKGNTMIIPVLQEITVIEKRILLGRKYI